MTESFTSPQSLVRLMQLASPALPVGAFSYSQGLESAVDWGWIRNCEETADWISTHMTESLVHVDLPVLKRLRHAMAVEDVAAGNRWIELLVCNRETRELREEERARGQAMGRVLAGLDLVPSPSWTEIVNASQIAGLTWLGIQWRLSAEELALAHSYGFLENLVTAAIKLVPLGQSDGQRLLRDIGGAIPRLVAQGMALEDDDIGACSQALAILSSYHEVQYTRLFRS